jgi:hypothetical protein
VTTVSIQGEKVFIDGQPTHAGRSFEGRPVEGLLFNVRAVQATFDDANPGTRHLWAYPDTGRWDPERNVTEFMAALPQWKAHGVLGFTLNFQGGGGRYLPEIYDTYDNNGFTNQGEIKPDFADRISRVLTRADELDMVVILGMFYWKQTLKMDGSKAVWAAVENALTFLRSTRHKNVMIELANETDVNFGMPDFTMEAAPKMIDHFKNRFPEFLISTSYVVGRLLRDGKELSDEFIRACDFIMPHGNGLRPEKLGPALDALKNSLAFKQAPKPVIINEDSTGVPNLNASFQRYISWGYYDQGHNDEQRQHDIWVDLPWPPRETKIADLSGFQTPPVNWTINTARKKAFFNRVAEITGMK